MKNKNYARLSILSLALLAAAAQAQSLPSGEDGTKIGNGAVAKAPSDVAIGSEAEAYRDPFYEVDEDGTVIVYSSGNTAVGTRSRAIGELNTAIGNGTTATGKYNTALGAASVAEGERNFSAGLSAYTNGTNNSAIGSQATAEGESSISIGTMSYSNGVGAQAIGGWSEAEGDSATAVGYMSKAKAASSTALGHGAGADEVGSTAVGASAHAYARGASAFGTGAGAHGENCTALGAGSACFEENTVSVGQYAQQRRIINVADGINDNEAANYGQLRQLGTVLGGGFGFDGGIYRAPTWNFQDGSSHTDITSVFENLDGRLHKVENNGGTGGKDGASAYEVAQNNGYAGSETDWLASLKGEKGDRGEVGPAGTPGLAGQDGRDGADSTVPGPIGPAGQDGKDGADGKDSTVAGPAGQDGKDSTVPGPKGEDGLNGKDGSGSGSDEMAVRYTNTSKTTAELAGSGGTRVSNVSNGRIAQGSTDAVNGGQVWQLQQDLNDRWDTTNKRIDRLEDRMNDRMNAISAKTAAISQVNVGGSYLEVGEGEFGMSPGFSSNKAALAAGYRFRTSEKWSFSGAISVGGGSPAMGAIGVHYKFSR